MSTSPQNTQRFTEKEVSAILRRAVEMQDIRTDEGGLAETSAGVSLTQLQQAGAELGIAPDLIEAAATEVAHGNVPGERFSFWGGPWRTDYERIVTGKVTEEDWPTVLDEIRSASGRVGNVSRVGKMFEWSSSSPDPLIVTITPKEEEARIRVMARYGDWGLALYVISLMAALLVSLGVSASQHLSLLAGLSLTVSLFIGAFLGARTAFNRLCKAKRRRTQEVMRRLESLIAGEEQSEAQSISPVTTYGETVEPLPQQVRTTL